MKKQYPYSNDKDFLSKLDAAHVQEQWVRIILLEYSSEIPIESIEGKVTTGTLTKTSDSAVRRTCSLSCAVDTFKYKIDDIKANYSISKKIYLELGVTNTTDEYQDEKIIWFPQGVFFITNFGISASATGSANINLQFKDKMAQLDGTVGGILPSTVRFDKMSTIVDGTIITNKVLVYDIIMEVVNHFGNENIANIIIDDIPMKAKRIIRWMGTESVWIYPILGTNGKISYDICFESDLDEKQSAHTPINNNGKIIAAKEYTTGQDIGYMYEDFVYESELTFNAGAKVTDVLDKIKQWLGNYEYFYDEQGQFHFQEIKNYLNNSQSAYIWDKIIETDDTDYLYESIEGKTVYTFSDDTNLVSITNTPMYEKIKNDFIVEGTVTNNNISRTCRYHLVIDEKPTISEEGYDNVLIYTDPSTGTSSLAKPIIVTPKYNSIEKKYIWSLPEFAEDGKIYGLLDEAQIHTFTTALNNISNFDLYYNDLVDTENTLSAEDIGLTAETRNYLFTLLERYMGYTDNSAYKEQYRKTIFTLARQLHRYNSPKQDPQLDTTLEYYEALYGQYILDIANYGSKAKSYISWCGELLRLLYDLFNGIPTSHRPSTNYTDRSYWPATNSTVLKLWEDMSTSNDTTRLRELQRVQCWRHINDLKMRQPQLSVLIEQYNQIINNYDIQINIYENKPNPTQADTTAKEQLIQKRTNIQRQVDRYKEQQEICTKRLNMLHAALTVLGTPNAEVGEVYFNIDIEIPVRATSFWYYDTDTSKDTYGWNELGWFKYFKKRGDVTPYYPYGIGSMTYIDYSKLDWGSFNFRDLIPSMNRYSDWYINYYVDHAKENDLAYFDDYEENRYIPFNWRTELLLMGLQAEENGTDPGPYYQELKLNLPGVYDFRTGGLSPSSISALDYFVGHTGVILGSDYQFVSNDFNTTSSKAKFTTKQEAAIENWVQNFENGSYYYFFDMIDVSSPTWGEYSVGNIGRRTNVTSNDSINCIFPPEIPNFAFLNVSGLTADERRKAYLELQDVSEEIIQVTNTLYQDFATGLSKQPAYEQIKFDLQQYTSYQNSVSITAIPCFYLEPNTLVELNDRSTNTFGDYVVKSISIPLGMSGTMSVSMSKAMGRL